MNKLSEKAAEATRCEWRELGFFYLTNDELKEWRLIGSKKGLACFAKLLKSYSMDDRNKVIGEHEHYGPHTYLEVMTSTTVGMNAHSIFGTTSDISRLADIVLDKLSSGVPGQTIRIREEFAVTAEYSLVLQVQSDEFDPASVDLQLAS